MAKEQEQQIPNLQQMEIQDQQHIQNLQHVLYQLRKLEKDQEDTDIISSKLTSYSNLIEQIEQSKVHFDSFSRKEIILLAICRYAITKISQKYKELEKAVAILVKGGLPTEIQLLWSLQLAALYSSHKKHQQSYNIAVRLSEQCLIILQKFKGQKFRGLINNVKSQMSDNNQQVPIWFYNKNHHLSKQEQNIGVRSLSDEVQFPHNQNQNSSKQYYIDDAFQIADIMSMEIPDLAEFETEVKILDQFEKKGFQGNQGMAQNTIQKIVLFLSIACFTRATQTYYMKRFDEKYYHVKAIKIARNVASSSNTFIEFLLSTLSDHYGKHLNQIQQVEEQSLSLLNQLRREMPKDTSEVSLKIINFAE